MRHHLGQKRKVGCHPVNTKLIEGAAHGVNGVIPSASVGDQFGQHRVIINSDFVAFPNARIDPHSCPVEGST